MTDDRIDDIINVGTIEEVKDLIRYFLDDDPCMPIRKLAEEYIGIHPSNFSPSATGRWRKAIVQLIESKEIQQVKRGTKSVIIKAS